jgi:4-hydroxybenzoate polyprenyltransferase
MGWLKLVRWKNLLIVLFTQLTVWACLILPLQPSLLTLLNFSCLALSTAFIAAAGYIINDYFDIKIDMVNRPDKMVLGKLIAPRTAIIPHAVLNVLALGMATYLAARAHHPEWMIIQVATITLLWFYSTHFKRQFVTGNVVVALLTALTVLTPGIYEPVMAQRLHLPFISAGEREGLSALPAWILGGYAYFAFMLTWMREIVKDMEDIKGDEADGCVTMPIKIGLKKTTSFVVLLAALAILPLAIGSYIIYHFQYRLLASYILALLILPLAVWAIALSRDTEPEHYHKASGRLKLIMLLGICSLFVYHFQLYLDRA